MVGTFSEGLAPARPYGVRLWGFVNAGGHFATPPKIRADEVGPLSGGLATIIVDGKTGYVNRSGKTVIEPSFVRADPFSDGFARVVTTGPCLYKTNDGPCSEPIILPGYVTPYEFRQHNAQSEVEVCRFSFIDGTGRLLTNLTFEDADGFSEGLAAVKIGKLWGYIDTTGAVVIPPSFTYAKSFADGRALVERARSTLEYINKSGQTVIPPRFKYADSFSEGLAAVSTGDFYIYIDRAGKQAIAARFVKASHFYKGLAHVQLMQKSDRFAYINRTGHIVFTYLP